MSRKAPAKKPKGKPTKKAPAKKPKTPAKKRKAPAKKLKTPAKKRKAPAKKSKGKSEKTPVIKRMTKKGLDEADLSKLAISQRSFSKRSSLQGGGNLTVMVASKSVALRILKKFEGSIDFWQLSKKYIITRKKQRIRATGYSKPRYPQGSFPKFPATSASKREISLALDETVANALRQVGYYFNYGDAPPKALREDPKHKGVFMLVIWYHGSDKSQFFRS